MTVDSEYCYKNLRINYRIRVSPRARNAYLKLLEDGTIEAVLPRRMSKRIVPDMLHENRQWITDMQLQLKTRQEKNPVRYETLPDKIDLHAIGEYWTVVYTNNISLKDARRKYEEDDSGLFKQLKISEQDPGKARVVLQRWLKQKALEHLVPWVNQVSESIGLPFNRVSIRAQKSRWGSCSREANINLNMALLFLSPELARYVFVHELCHTKHMNHSQNYWKLVERFEPDYKKLDRSLNSHSEVVPLWIHK